jgi:hypothetical protein
MRGVSVDSYPLIFNCRHKNDDGEKDYTWIYKNKKTQAILSEFFCTY